MCPLKSQSGRAPVSHFPGVETCALRHPHAVSQLSPDHPAKRFRETPCPAAGILRAGQKGSQKPPPEKETGKHEGVDIRLPRFLISVLVLAET